jgi:hypothetical protein
MIDNLPGVCLEPNSCRLRAEDGDRMMHLPPKPLTGWWAVVGLITSSAALLKPPISFLGASFSVCHCTHLYLVLVAEIEALHWLSSTKSLSPVLPSVACGDPSLSASN